MAVSVALSVKARPFKRTKRHTAAKGVQKSARLPVSKVGLDNEFDGPFRSNVRLLLMKYGWEVPLPPALHREGMLPYLMTWRVVLEFACMDVVMHVIEEDVRRSRSVYCDNCRVAAVIDVSKKHEMEYRLLHAVAKGHPWYGEWGYEFGGGSFALTSEAYHYSIDDISNIPLSFFFSHARSPRTPLQNTIALYWSLSDRQLLTVRDLFCFVMQLLQDVHACGEQSTGNTVQKISEASQGVLCPWTKADVEMAEEAMIKVLRASHGSQWVSWRALRGATCRAVGSPELLDYCLKGLGGKLTDDGMAVAVRCNQETSCIEYRLEVDSTQPCHAQSPTRPSRDHLLHNLRFLYDALLNPATMEHYKPEATRESALISTTNILDCKQFVKRYNEVASNPSKLRIWCNVELVDQQNENIVPSPELLVLPKNATIASLKREATKAFQETYLIFQRFQAEELLGFEKVGHSTPVALLLGLNGTVKVRGKCLGGEHKLGHFRMERGTEMWIVDCVCDFHMYEV